MKSHPWIAEIEIPEQVMDVAAESLYAVLQGVNDQRAKRGQRYEAALVLTLMLLAKLASEQSLRGIAQWVHLRVTWLQTVLPCLDTRTPCANTYRYIHINVDELNHSLGRFFAQAHEAIATGEESKPSIHATDLPAAQARTVESRRQVFTWDLRLRCCPCYGGLPCAGLVQRHPWSRPAPDHHRWTRR